MNTYAEFLESKRIVAPTTGIEIAETDIHDSLFGFQSALVRWSGRKGRAALFASTGLGKTRIKNYEATLAGNAAHLAAVQAVDTEVVLT